MPSPLHLLNHRSALISSMAMLLGFSLLTSCYSAAHPKRDPHEPLKWNERMAQQKGDMNKVMGADKTIKPSDIGDRGAMTVMGRKSYSAGDYKGNTDYKGTKSFKTKDFAGSNKTNRAETQLSRMGSQQSKVADKTFGTKDSRWSNKTAHTGDKSFRGSTTEYKTADFAPGKKSIEQNKRPYFQPATNLDKTKAYAEEDVKALLNRN